MLRCYIGLGSNLQAPGQQLSRALTELAVLPDSHLHKVSSFYQSPPLGPPQQPDFINAVAALDTGLPALELLSALQAIEALHLRVRTQHWGPRTLDLDLLLYGDEQIRHPRLCVPHAEIKNRNFVLIPLYEIAPALTIPGLGELRQLVAQTDHSALAKVDIDGSKYE